MIPNWSVVIPSYEQGSYIAEAIESVLTQRGVAVEVLVEDGGSVDSTIDVLKTYGDRVSWVSRRDEGQADAINRGFGKAAGEYVAYLNSDDILEPDILHQVAEIFERNTDVDFVYGCGMRIRSDGTEIDYYPVERFDLERIKDTCFICQPACFWRRSVHEKIGYFNINLNFALDYDFWIRAALAGCKFHFFPKVLARARIHDAAKTTAQRLAAFMEAFSVVRSYFPGYVSRRWVCAIAQAKSERHLLHYGWSVSAVVKFLADFPMETYTIAKTYGVKPGLWMILRAPIHLLVARRKLITIKPVLAKV